MNARSTKPAGLAACRNLAGMLIDPATIASMGLTAAQVNDGLKGNPVVIAAVREELADPVQVAIRRHLSSHIPEAGPQVPANHSGRAGSTVIVKSPLTEPMGKQQWLDREMGWLEKVAKVTGVQLTPAQRAAIDGYDEDAAVWRPDTHIVPAGLKRGSVLALADACRVRLWGGCGANCGGSDTPTVAAVQQWDLDILLEGRYTGAAPWNMRCPDQMAWARLPQNGTGPWLPVEWLLALAQYQDEYKRRPTVLDQHYCWFRTEERGGATCWVCLYSRPDDGVDFHWFFDRHASGECGVASRKCIITLPLCN